MNQRSSSPATRLVLPVAVVIAAGVLAFLLVMLFTEKSRNSATPQTVPPQTTSSSTVVPSDSRSSSRSSSVSLSSSSSKTPTSESVASSAAVATSASSAVPATSSPSAVAADFPANSTTKCSIDGKNAYSTIRETNVRNESENTSCGFDTEINIAVGEKLSADPNASRFTVSPYSVVRGENREFSCVHADHLTTCTALEFTTDIYIKDTDN